MNQFYCITYTSKPDNGCQTAFEVHISQGIVKFKSCSCGLHYLDLSEGSNAEVLHLWMVPTVQDRFVGYSKHDVLGAIETQRLQNMVSEPSNEDYEGMVCEKMIKNFPVDNNDIKIAHIIFGPDFAGLRGRTV